MDGEYYLDSSGQFGVFLNGKKVSFAHLKEKDLITIGGGSGLEKIGDTLNEHFLKPCITYMFTASSFVKDKENIYTRKNDDSLITLQDIFDGHCISESFCEEDFNATMDAVSFSMPKMNESLKFSNVLQNKNQSICTISTSQDIPCSQPSQVNCGQSSDSSILANVEKTISVTLAPHSNRVSSLLNPSITISSTTISSFNGNRTVPIKTEEQSTTLTQNCTKQSSVTDECCLPSSALCSPMPTCFSIPFKVSACTPEKLSCPSQPSKVNSYSPTLAKAALKRKSDADDHLLLKQWKNADIEKPKPKFVDIHYGAYGTEFLDQEIFRVTKDENCIGTQATISIDIPGLEYKLKKCLLSTNDYNKLFDIVTHNCKLSYKMSRFNLQCLHQPKQLTYISPGDFKVTLKHYQIVTASWMKELEETCEQGFTLSRLIDWKEFGSSVLFDIAKKLVYFPPIKDTSVNSLTVRSKGGILADEMGLGKTITMLALLVSHKKEGPRVPSFDAVSCKNRDLLPTAATLIIAPSHLTSQWKEEALKCSPSLKTVLITVRSQYQKVSYADILFADLVIVSEQFLLTNDCYKNLPRGEDAFSTFHLLMRKPGVNPLLECSPNLCHFKWWRIVCDEAHELMSYQADKTVDLSASSGQGFVPGNGFKSVHLIESTYRWYLTGTPFPNAEKSLRAALYFIGATTNDPCLQYADGSLRVDNFQTLEVTNGIMHLHEIILRYLYARNTKQGIGIEYDVPEYVEELMLLKFSNVEQAIYDRTQSETQKRQICCHLQISENMQNIAGTEQQTLQQVKEAMINHTRQAIDDCNEKISDIEFEITETRWRLADETAPSKKQLLRERIQIKKDSIEKERKTIADHEATITYFESLIPRIENLNEEACVVCFESIQSLTITPCGHLFCHTCIVSCVEKQGCCPTCRKTIKEEQLIKVNDEEYKLDMTRRKEVKQLTEKYGTKMAYLIVYLRCIFQEDQKSRVIIFSQWEYLMDQVKTTLESNKIHCKKVKGNVFTRNKAISAFKNQENFRVIMLSLDSAASGTNLVEATHVILLDPVAGSKEKSIDIEMQAIGRAHRMGQNKRLKVVRLIMRDTIEHEIYARNYAGNDMEQLELIFDSVTENYGARVLSSVKSVPLPTK